MNANRSVRIFSLALAVLALASMSMVQLASGAGEVGNGAIALTDQHFKTQTRGEVIATAAINADGTIAKCYNCNSKTTLHIATGQYQVGFTTTVKANVGISRWVTPDTLNAGRENTWCDTADRAAVAGAIWVNCQTASGAVDTSFFLFVAK